jgi:hypothetical protein
MYSTSNISVLTGLKSHFSYTGLGTHSERQSHRTDIFYRYIVLNMCARFKIYFC